MGGAHIGFLWDISANWNKLAMSFGTLSFWTYFLTGEDSGFCEEATAVTTAATEVPIVFSENLMISTLEPSPFTGAAAALFGVEQFVMAGAQYDAADDSVQWSPIVNFWVNTTAPYELVVDPSTVELHHKGEEGAYVKVDLDCYRDFEGKLFEKEKPKRGKGKGKAKKDL